MEESREMKLKEAGVDIKTAMNRFMGNEALLMRFLKKFDQDPNYELFKKCMEEKQYDEAFKAAHTLKGLCGNLSLSGMFDVVSREVEALRAKEYQKAEGILPEVVEEYERVVKILGEV